jgi:hypothetical protein
MRANQGFATTMRATDPGGVVRTPLETVSRLAVVDRLAVVGRLVVGRLAVGALLVLGLAACTATSSGKPVTAAPATGPTTGPPTALATDTAHGNLSAYCTSLAAAASKILAAEVALYSGGGNASIAPLVSELSALRAGAPPQIQASLSELIAGFTTAGQVLSHPTKDNEAQLVTLGPKLAADSQTISAYVVSQCPAH